MTQSEHNGVDRRAFFRAAAGVGVGVGVGLGSAGLLAGPAAATRHGAPRRIPPGRIGMHMYTMRGSAAADSPGTYARLAEIGYKTIGVSGRHGHTPAEIRRMLDDNGLTAVLEHVGFDRLTNNWEQAVEEVLVLGGKWAVIPSFPRTENTPDEYRRVAEMFNVGGEICREYGISLLYHNHNWEFETVDGQVLYDVLLEETEPGTADFVLDVYWAARGGYDAGDYFRNHPRRFPALHVKDMAEDGSFADVGAGVLDFPEMFDTARRGGVTDWLVEHDAPADEWVSAQNSYDALLAMRY